MERKNKSRAGEIVALGKIVVKFFLSSAKLIFFMAQRQIFYLWDTNPSPLEWAEQFELHISQRRDLNLKKILEFGPTQWDGVLSQLLREARPGDILISRPKDNQDTHVPIQKQDYRKLLEVFPEENVHPRPRIYDFFEDKKKQVAWMQEYHYPCPFSTWLESPEKLEDCLKFKKLEFPFVTKTSQGNNSKGVSLAFREADIRFPCVAQEFCKGTRGEYRMIFCGNILTGYWRENPPNDFRASGSGRKRPLEIFEPEIVRIVKHILSQHPFHTGCIDFIKRAEKDWVITEFSYLWPLKNANYLLRTLDLETFEERSLSSPFDPALAILKGLIREE